MSQCALSSTSHNAACAVWEQKIAENKNSLQMCTMKKAKFEMQLYTSLLLPLQAFK